MSTSAPSTVPAGYVRVESQVEGITVYAPAPPVKTETTREFKCPNCGATTAFDPRAGSVTCSNCGSQYAIHAQLVGRAATEFEFTLDTLNSAPRGWGSTRRSMHCQDCGAETSVAPTELATTCPFCGSNRVVARTGLPADLSPRFLVPFKIERAQCAPLTRAWLARGWLYPRGLVNAARSAQFTGIYLPFWTFRAQVRAFWRAEVGHERLENYFDVDSKTFKQRHKIEWRWETGQTTLPFLDELGTGTRHISPALLRRLEPYNLDALVTYDPGYLAGWQAQAYEIPLNTAWDAARGEMREEARQACLKQIDSNYVRNFSLNAVFDDEAWRFILLPAFITTYRFGNQSYQLVVNGQTGIVAGVKPVAWVRVWFVIAALLLPGLLLMGLALALGAAGESTGGLFLLGGGVLSLGALFAVWVLQQANKAGAA